MLDIMKILTFLALCGLVAAQSRRNPYGNYESARTSPAGQHRDNNRGPRMTAKLARTINKLGSIEEFLQMINKDRDGSRKAYRPESVEIGSRFGGVERSNAKLAMPAMCMPESTTVSLDNDNDDSTIIYFPSCTRVKRCGGCCQSLFSCQPKETILRNFEVIVSRLTLDGRVIEEERKIIPIEEHTRCECDCIMKPTDCHPKHVYDEEYCECRCTNEDDEEKCDRNSEKFWDPTTCSCHCRQEEMCNLGWIFNPETCRCQRQQTSYFDNQRGTTHRYSEKPKSRDNLPGIVPPDIDSRRRSNKDDPEYK